MTKSDPIPSYAGLATFMRAPVVSREQLTPEMIAVFGAPFESSTRYGARMGPRAIREQSIHYQYYIDSDSSAEIFDVDTGRTMRKSDRARIVDLGDVNVYPLDAEKSVASISGMTDAIVSSGAFPVMLGGDHMVTWPSFLGFHNAVRRKNPQARVGYIHLDAHFDLGDENPIYGRVNNATLVKRIMELEGVRPSNMSLVGLRGIARKSQVKLTIDSGMNYYPMPVIRQRGLEAVIREAAERASDGCDAVYVTYDIDVIDVIHAPGNGGIAFGGLTNMEGLQVADILAQYSAIKAFDVVEVNPHYDLSDITTKFAATAILKFLMPKLFAIS
jgi:arginase family enzyme